MRWITYAACLCFLGMQLSHAMPALDQDQNAIRETLQTVDKELGSPTAESSFREKRTVGVFRRIFPEISKTKLEERAQDNALSEGASEAKEVRVPYVPSEPENDLKSEASEGDNEEAESSQEEVSDDIDISESEENSRSKRLGVFGNLLGGFSGGSGGSSGGGSGNFLFDIIRRTADGAARAAGSVYRFAIGTADLGLNGYSNDLTVPTVLASRASSPRASTSRSNARSGTGATVATATTTATASTLVAGSGATEQQDENANAPLAPTGSDQAQPLPADDGYQAGIPGPITRLFVIANRGIANLVQDLILRLAQTSERIVNFKARLITAII